jgi:hypothetical protein
MPFLSLLNPVLKKASFNFMMLEFFIFDLLWANQEPDHIRQDEKDGTGKPVLFPTRNP